MYCLTALIAYVTDAIFGEFRFVRHPVVWMGDFIGWYERRFYRDSRLAGAGLAVSLLAVVMLLSLPLTLLPFWVQGIVASMFLAHRMLHDSVHEAIGQREKVAMLVSRDTQSLSQSDLNKALVETYAENLSDGVIAPLFYLLFFGVPGAALYKAINTLDSMVGYRTNHYENFGWFSAKLDDLANLIPARLTAVMVLFLCQNRAFMKLRHFAKGHKSPNAGYPISAVALCFGLKLGGDTPYHGKMVVKPWFGEGRKEIRKEDIVQVLQLRRRVDILLVTLLSVCAIFVR